MSLINGDSLTFSLFLSLPCCCQCRFKRYTSNPKTSKIEETIPLWRQPSFLTICLLSFHFSFDGASHKSHDSFFLSVFLFFKDSNKKTAENSPIFLSFFLSFLNIMYKYTQMYKHKLYTYVLNYQELIIIDILNNGEWWYVFNSIISDLQQGWLDH